MSDGQTPSGKLVVRMPIGLHAALAREATNQNTSLNALIVALLAGGIGFKLPQE